MLLEPMEWAAIGLQAADNQEAWTKVARQLSNIGLEQAGLVHDYPMIERAFPDDHHILGHIVSKAWEDHCRAEVSRSDDFFDIATPSSLVHVSGTTSSEAPLSRT